MPFDMFGWSPNTPTGFGGYQTGNYFKPVFGYDDYGNAVNSSQQWNQIQQQRMNPAPTTPAPMAGPDFFSQLAGLMGVPLGMPQGNPAQQQPQGSNLGQQIAKYNQYANRPTVITPGGQGPYGGVSKEGQRQMFEGTARAWGQAAQDRGLGYEPTPSSPYQPPNKNMRDPMNRGVGPGRGMASGRASAGRNPLSNLPNRGGSL